MKCNLCHEEYDDGLLECPHCGHPPLEKLDKVNVPKQLSHYSREELFKRIKSQSTLIKYRFPIGILILLMVSILFISIVSNNKNDTMQSSPNIRLGSTLSYLNTIGNTPGNINNSGIATSGSNYIYTINDQHYLMRVTVDFSSYELLGRYKAKNINIVNNIVYFTNIDDHHYIYRYSLKDKTATKVVDHAVSLFQVVGDWIYYIDSDDNNSLYSIKVDGSNKTKLNSKSCHDLFISGDWIYYSDETTGLYKLPLKGGEAILVIDVVMSKINIVDNMVYFIQLDGSIARASLSNTKEIEYLYEVGADNLIASSDGLYFLNEDKYLCFMKFDGSNYKVLSSNKVDYFNIVREWLIYYSNDQYYKLSRFEDEESNLLNDTMNNLTPTLEIE